MPGLSLSRSIAWFTLRPMRGALTVAALVLGGGFSAHAGLIVIEQAQARNAAAAAHAAAFDAQDHFPGAALFYPTAEAAATGADATHPGAPASGATGTVALPDVPMPAFAMALAGDTSVKPATPFSLAGASAEARGRAQQCLTAAIYYEAASESEQGQRAVAQVVLNRLRHPAFPASVCGVVYQGSERGSGCQFSFACDGSMARVPSRTGWALAARYATDALNGYVMPTVGEATHYHTYAVSPAWNRSLVMTAAIGAHFFQRWQGWQGTPGAFRQAYARVEPFPGPKPRLLTAGTGIGGAGIGMAGFGLPGLGIPPVAPVAPGAAPATAAFTPAPDVLPAFADSGRRRDDAAPVVAPTAGALPETTMLDKWSGTGQPLK